MKRKIAEPRMVATINRTILELKFMVDSINDTARFSINRTILELKYKKEFHISTTGSSYQSHHTGIEITCSKPTHDWW